MRGTKIIPLILLLGVVISHAGYITPPLQAVLDTLSPGNKTPVCVHLLEKPNLSKFPQKAYTDKIAYLREFALQKQEPLIAFVNSFGGLVEDIKSFWVFNGISFKGTKEVILEVAPRIDVEFVSGGELEPLEEPTGNAPPIPRQIEWNIERVRANEVWQIGYTGEGIVICIFDSGMREDHESYGAWPFGKWRTEYGWRNAWYDASNDSGRPWDPQGHGTHVGGIAIGGDGYGGSLRDIGVAPGAKLIACRPLSSHDCFEWIAGLAENGWQPDVVNCSWGDRMWMWNLEFWGDVHTLRSLGIIPVFCIGNTDIGFARNWPPGNFPTVIGVGATKVDNQLAWFSCHGPAPDSFPWNYHYYWSRPDWDSIKPDIVAPGCSTGTESSNTVGILSATKDGTTTYGKMWGTSQATLHVTGAIALMLEASQDKWNYDLNYYDIYDILLETANRQISGSPNNYYGWGRLDCYEAVNAVLNYHLKSSSPTATAPNNGDRVAYGGDKWHMVYESGGPMAKYVRYTVSTDNGTTWSLEANGSQGERIGKISEGSNPALSVLPNGDAHVVWLDGSYLLYSKKLASSSVWTEPIVLYDEESMQKTPCLVVDPSTNIGYVTFVNESVFGKKVIYGWFDTQNPVLDYFTVDQGEVSHPSIGLGTNGPHIAWCKASGLMKAIYYTCAPNWLVVQISNSIKLGIACPDLVVSPYNGTVMVVWEEKNGNNFDIRCRRKILGFWQPFEWVCQTAEESRHPVITANAFKNHYYVAWADSTADYDWEILFSIDNGLGWQVPENLSECEFGSKNPQIGFLSSETGVGDMAVIAYGEGSSAFLLSHNSKYVPVYNIKTVSKFFPFGGGGQQASGDESIKSFCFENIHPNPAKEMLKIKFNSPDERKVTVKLYDVTGRLVQNLFNDKAQIGINEILITSDDLSSGVYFVKIEAKAYSRTERVIFLR